jgi:hypothetical protein
MVMREEGAKGKVSYHIFGFVRVPNVLTREFEITRVSLVSFESPEFVIMLYNVFAQAVLYGQ